MRELLFFINSRLFRVEVKEESECRECIKLDILLGTAGPEYVKVYPVIFSRYDLWIPSKKVKVSRTEYHCFDDNIQLQSDGTLRVINNEEKVGDTQNVIHSD